MASAQPAATTPRAIDPERGYLGVLLTEICPEVRAQTTLKAGEGLMIGEVAPESPAFALGLIRYDILTRFNDQQLMTPAQFVTLVENTGPGSEVQLSYLRQGQEVIAKIKLARPPAVPMSPTPRQALRPDEMLAGIFRVLRENPVALEAVHRMLSNPALAPEDFAMAGVKHGSKFTLLDEAGEVELTTVGKSQYVRAWNTEGKSVADCPYNTPEQRSALSPELTARLANLQKKCGSSLTTPLPNAIPASSSPSPAPVPPDLRASPASGGGS